MDTLKRVYMDVSSVSVLLLEQQADVITQPSASSNLDVSH